jgi:hypothetical protein
MSHTQLLILTNSRDLTVDRLIRRIGVERVFRFNFDTWEEYRFGWDVNGFWIKSPVGRSVTQEQIAKCLWRKPLSRFRLDGILPETVPEVRRYIESEVNAFLDDVRSALWRTGRMVLIEPDSGSRLGKFVQLQVAREFFRVPPFSFCYPLSESTLGDKQVVVKSLSGERVVGNKGLWTTAVDPAILDPETPWFMQQLVHAAQDVTVAFVVDESFAFGLDRSLFESKTLDWREAGKEVVREWRPFPLPESVATGIQGFMHALGLHYGRLDFLVDGHDWFFLEVNANGEWDWLDPDKGRGLFERILQIVDPDRPLVPIPSRWIAPA